MLPWKSWHWMSPSKGTLERILIGCLLRKGQNSYRMSPSKRTLERILMGCRLLKRHWEEFLWDAAFEREIGKKLWDVAFKRDIRKNSYGMSPSKRTLERNLTREFTRYCLWGKKHVIDRLVRHAKFAADVTWQMGSVVVKSVKGNGHFRWG